MKLAMTPRQKSIINAVLEAAAGAEGEQAARLISAAKQLIRRFQGR